MMRTTSRSWLNAEQVGWGLSQPWSAEISETLHLPKKTVQSTLHTARTRLAAMLVGLSSAVADYESPAPIQRTHAKANRERTPMTSSAMWGLAAAAAILLAVFVVTGFPAAGPGTESTIGAAQRYQAPQIEAKDVALGDTSAQAVMQTETWDRIVKDDTLRTLLQDASFRTQLRDAALQNQAFLDALRNSDFRAQLADPQVAAALAGAAFQNALRDPGFAAALQHEQFANALAFRGDCDEFGCGMNSPIVDGARIE